MLGKSRDTDDFTSSSYSPPLQTQACLEPFRPCLHRDYQRQLRGSSALGRVETIGARSSCTRWGGRRCTKDIPSSPVSATRLQPLQTVILSEGVSLAFLDHLDVLRLGMGLPSGGPEGVQAECPGSFPARTETSGRSGLSDHLLLMASVYLTALSLLLK